MKASELQRFVQFKEATAILKRVTVTIGVQMHLADRWMWSGKDIATWEADSRDLHGNDPESTSGRFLYAEADLALQEATWQNALDALHRQTVVAVGIARIRWRLVPARMLVVAALSARGVTAEDILAEALAWETAWEKVEPAFVPADGLTLASFQQTHAAARALERPLRLAELERQLSAGGLGVALDKINDDAQRWYAEATTLFDDPESAEYAAIQQIPTTFVPRYYEAAKRRRAARRKAAAEETPAAE